MKKTFCALLVIVCVCLSWASDFPDERRIYVLDVTKSMEGKGVVPTPNIFDSVKTQLKMTIDSIDNSATEIVIIPFTNKVHKDKIISGYASQKDSIKQKLDELKTLGGDTNIADAWDAGVAALDSSLNKVNYLFLLTDGLNNCGHDDSVLYRKLNEWGLLSKDRYFFSFYVMLTENAKDKEIRAISDSVSQMWRIESMNINALFVAMSFAYKINVKNGDVLRFPFLINRTGIGRDYICAKVKLQDNQYYSLKSDVAKIFPDGTCKVNIVKNKPYEEMPSDLTLRLEFYNDSADSMLFFTPNKTKVTFVNREERTMSFRMLKEK